MGRLRAWLFFAAKGALSIVLLAYLIGRVGIENIEASFVRPSYTAAVLSCVLLAAYFASGSLRWALVLRALGHRIAVRDVLEFGLIVQFFSQFLPASVGADILRVWQSAKAGLGVLSAVSSVLLERATFLAALGVMVGFLFPACFAGLFPDIYSASFAGLGLVTVVGAALLASADRFPAAWLSPYAAKQFGRLGEDARKFYRSPRLMLWGLAIFLAGQAAFAATLALLAEEFGIDISPVAYLAVGPITILVGAVPVSIAGWGVREVVLVELLTRLGAEASQALQLSLTVGVMSIIASLPGALLWLGRRRGIRLADSAGPIRPSERDS